MKHLVASAIVGLFLLTVGTGTVSAASAGGLGIFPATYNPDVRYSDSWFIYNLVPGETKEDAVLITNTSDETISAKLYPVDATTTKDGAFALREQSESRDDVGAWVSLSRSEVTVGPGEKITVPFTISIPPGAAVGDHIGGIILENNRSRELDGGINIISRVGVRIYQTVPGDLVRELAITEMGHALIDEGVRFRIGLENKGNVHLNPRASVDILDGFFGRKFSSFEADLRTIFPEKPTLVPFVWKDAPPFGKFIARTTVNYGEDGNSSRIVREYAFSYITTKGKAILALGGILLGLFVVIVNLRR